MPYITLDIAKSFRIVPPNADIHAKWVAWREEETGKRAAFMAYQFDSEQGIRKDS